MVDCARITRSTFSFLLCICPPLLPGLSARRGEKINEKSTLTTQLVSSKSRSKLYDHYMKMVKSCLIGICFRKSTIKWRSG